MWFIRRSSRSRYDSSIKSIEKTKIETQPETATMENYVDDRESENISGSLTLIRDYYNIKTSPQINEPGKKKSTFSKKQLQSHLDKILNYIITKLDYFRQNYGKELIEENYILETVLKFGTSSIELIINYKAIAFAIKEIYPDSLEKKSEVDKLFLGAADILNSKELHEVIKDNTKK